MITDYPNLPKIPKGLKDAFLEERTALFLGAGVSIPGGAPDWEELINLLLTEAEIDAPSAFDSSMPLPRLLSLYLTKGNRKQLRDSLQKELDAHGDLAVHEALLRLPVKLLITTNYDRRLDRAAEKLGIDIKVIASNNSVSDLAPGRRYILHLYGTTEDKQPLTTEEDLIRFRTSQPALSAVLEYIFLTHNVFFLGFSLRDSNILNHIFSAVDLIGGADEARRDYAFMLNPEPTLVDILSKRNLEIFGVTGLNEREDFSKCFLDFIESLTDEVANLSYENRAREKIVDREERDYFYKCKEKPCKLVLRRESTFSVFALPEGPGPGVKESQIRPNGERKQLYQEWITAGEMKLILNLEADYILRRRSYPREVAVNRLQHLRICVEENLDNPRFVVAARKDFYGGPSHAALGERTLIVTKVPDGSEGPAYKASRILREPEAVRVFNRFFDRELSSLSVDRNGRHVDGDGNLSYNHKLLKEKLLKRIGDLISELRPRN